METKLFPALNPLLTQRQYSELEEDSWDFPGKIPSISQEYGAAAAIAEEEEESGCWEVIEERMAEMIPMEDSVLDDSVTVWRVRAIWSRRVVVEREGEC
jgi:hypothetical protein